MEHKPNCQSVESLYRQHQPMLVGYVRSNFPSLSMEAFDVVQEVFVKLETRGTGVLGDVSPAALTKHTWQKAEDRRRWQSRIKRDSGKVSSLDAALEDVGFEPVANESEPQQELILQAVHQLEIADRVIEKAIPQLLERELILVRHIRKWVPVELSLEELSAELSPSERVVFFPLRRDSSLERVEKDIIRQISRSKSSLQEKLRNVRASLGL